MDDASRIYQRLDDLCEDTATIKGTVIRIEEQNIACSKERDQHSERLGTHAIQIDNLKTDNNRAKGAMWAMSIVNGLILLFIAIYAFIQASK